MPYGRRSWQSERALPRISCGGSILIQKETVRVSLVDLIGIDAGEAFPCWAGIYAIPRIGR